MHARLIILQVGRNSQPRNTMTILNNEGDLSMWHSSEPDPHDITEILTDIPRNRRGPARSILEQDLVGTVVDLLKNKEITLEDLRNRLKGPHS